MHDNLAASFSRSLTRRRLVTGLAATTGGLILPTSRAFGQDQIIEPADPETPIDTAETPTPASTQAPTSVSTIEPTPAQNNETTITTESGGGSTSLYFATTGHNLMTPFLEVWQRYGGETVFGQPLSEARFVDDNGTVQQAFETLTLEYNPAYDDEWAVQGTHMANSVITSVASSSDRAKVTSCPATATDCQFFADSGHTMSGKIAAFWTEHGGLPIFGLPLSEPFTKSKVTTQVFERAILDQDASGTVSIRKIVAERIQANGLANDAAFQPAPPTLGTTTLVKAEDGLRLRSAPSDDADVLVVLPDNAEFIAAGDTTVDWVPGYVDGYAGWVASDFLTEPEELPTLDTADWDLSVWQGAALGETNVRAQPDTTSKLVKTLAYGDPVVVDWVEGEEVFEDANIWAKLKDGTYIYARNIGRAAPVEPTPIPTNAPASGKWIDVNLTQQLMIAYEGTSAIRTCVMTAGMPGHDTPEGYFAINTRVANETMEAGTIGADGYYKLENVLFTQYFTDVGHAIHFAWWRTKETIGRPGSHGCLNLLLDDSQFFWDWAEIGTVVLIHP